LSESGFDLAKRWLNECIKNHPICMKGDNIKPRRLLEICLNNTPAMIKLVDTNEVLAPYVCLSHCWGQVITSCLTLRDNMHHRQKGILYDELPKTFQDAVIITTRLGFTYLWIDSLCIVQDDILDWQNESKQMCSIYSNAALTIAASASKSSNEGFFRKSSPEHIGKPVSIDSDVVGSAAIFSRETLRHQSILDSCSPLLKRAWVFQERLLSPRMLHFTSQELIFECRERTWCECSNNQDWVSQTNLGISWQYPYENPKLSHSSALQNPSSPSLGDEWRKMVGRYSILSMTFPKDMLPAISGLAREMQPMRGVYLAGLWVDTFIEDLAWWAKFPQSPRPAVWRGPTWSWISINTSVEHVTSSMTFSPTAKLILWEYVTAGQDPTGGIKSASVTLCGLAMSVQLLKTSLLPTLPELYEGPINIRSASIILNHILIPFIPDYGNDTNGWIHDIDDEDSFLCFKLGTSSIFGGNKRAYALVLRKKLNASQYERIGLVLDDEFLLDAELIKDGVETQVAII
jgi:hypothetical protein